MSSSFFGLRSSVFGLRFVDTPLETYNWLSRIFEADRDAACNDATGYITFDFQKFDNANSIFNKFITLLFKVKSADSS